MPSGMKFVRASGRGWRCTDSRAGTGYTVEPDVNGSLTCRRTLQGVAAGTVLDALVVTVQLDPAASGDPVVPGRAVFTGDRDPSDDNADRSTAPTPVTELSVAAVTGRHRALVGDDVVYEVVVTKQRPAPAAAGVEARATMPDALEAVSAAGDGWTCSIESPSDLDTGGWRCWRMLSWHKSG